MLKSKAAYAPKHKRERDELIREDAAWYKQEAVGLREEKEYLEERVERLEKEMVIIDSYIEVMETGVDYKTMLKFYTESKALVDAEKKKHATTQRRADKEIAKLKGKLAETQAKLKQLWFDVYKPLMQEVVLKEEIINRVNAEKDKLWVDFKMLNSIIRLPRMCTEY